MIRLFGLLLALLLSPLTVFADGGQANLFIYHRFGESAHASTNVDVETFRNHLDILRKNKIQVVPLGELVRLLEEGRLGEQHLAVLTVDDGFRSFLQAFELLREYGFPVTLFVNTDSVGGRSYLTWKELAALQQQGVEIGNHSASHPHMVNRKAGETRQSWLERLRKDLEKSQEAFRRHLGRVPDLFAYPYGEFDPDVKRLVREMGFRAAVAQQSGVVHAGSDLFALPRFPMGGPYAGTASFRDKLAMKPLPVVAVEPESPILARDNPPVLELVVKPDNLIVEQLACYVAGQGRGNITWIDRKRGRLRLRADRPLSGRRGKYTLTAPGRNGGWYWYSHLWIRPEIPENGY